MKDIPYNTPLTRIEGEAFKKGGRAKAKCGLSMKTEIKRVSGSETHKSIAKEPSLRRLKAAPKDVKPALPRNYTKDNIEIPKAAKGMHIRKTGASPASKLFHRPRGR